jgi:uncharacterized protein YuzE
MPTISGRPAKFTLLERQTGEGATVTASYHRFSNQPVANPQIFVDEGCILDLDADGHLIGIEIIGPRTLLEVLPAILVRARFR